MVASGLGITFLPGLYVKAIVARDPSVRTMEVQGLNMYRLIGMAWRKSTSRGDSFRQLAELAKTNIGSELRMLVSA